MHKGPEPCVEDEYVLGRMSLTPPPAAIPPSQVGGWYLCPLSRRKPPTKPDSAPPAGRTAALLMAIDSKGI